MQCIKNNREALHFMKYHNIQIPKCFENLYRGELDKYRILVYYGKLKI